MFLVFLFQVFQLVSGELVAPAVYILPFFFYMFMSPQRLIFYYSHITSFYVYCFSVSFYNRLLFVIC